MISQEVLNSFKGKRVMVTGGTGLIGRPVVDMLVQAGAETWIASLDDLKPNPGAKYVKVDLRNNIVTEMLMNKMDIVFHIAGIKGGVDVTKAKPSTVFVPYLQFNTNVLEACRTENVGKVVYTSTIGAYKSAEIFKEGEIIDGEPMDMFAGWAKRMAELQIKSYKIQYGLKNFIAVRPANVYGVGDNFDPANAMVIPSLMYRIQSGESPVKIWGNGSAIRDFAYNVDIAEGILLAAYHMPDVDYLNLGSGIGYTIKDLVDTLHEFINFNHEWDTTKPNGFPKRILDISNAQRLINFNPTTTLRQGLEQTWKWFLDNKDEFHKRKNYFTTEV